MGRKIGEIKQINEEWYQCVQGRCKDCYFSEKRYFCKQFITKNLCTSGIIFKRLEKVGEPYTTSNDKVMQNYLIETEVFGYPKGIFILTNYGQGIIAIEIKQTKEDMEEKKLNLKPFSLEAAKAGKPVCTRDGRKARIICFDAKDITPIIALVLGKNSREEVQYYDRCGRIKEEKESPADLMMLPEKKEGWVNIYRSQIYNTLEKAEEAYEITGNDDNYLQTIKIVWEE